MTKVVTKKRSSLSKDTVKDYLTALTKQLSEGVYIKTPSKQFISSILSLAYVSNIDYADINNIHSEALSQIDKLIANYMLNGVEYQIFGNEKIFLEVIEDFYTACLLTIHTYGMYTPGRVDIWYNPIREYVIKVKEKIAKRLSELVNADIDVSDLNTQIRRIPILVVLTQRPNGDLVEGIDYIRAKVGRYVFYILAKEPDYRYGWY